MAACHGNTGAVLAVHDDGRHAVDSVFPGHDAGETDLVVDREGVECPENRILVDALFSHPVRNLFRRVEGSSLPVQGVIEFYVQLVSQAQRLEGVIHPCMKCPVFIQDGGNGYKLGIFRFVFQPPVQVGLQAVAMGAAVPEHLHHFDLVPGLDRLNFIEQFIVSAFHVFAVLGHALGGEQQAESRE